ncbi:MAG: sugar transferase [Clostridia bacterium]|nr:sugar transferase [Clostridia bacterium]
MYRRQSSGWMKHYDFMLIDLLCLHASFILAYIIRHGFFNPYADELYRNMAIFVTLADLVVMFLFGSYRGILWRRISKEVSATFRHALAVILLSVLYLFSVQQSFPYSRVTLYLMWLFYTLSLFGCRCWRKYAITHSKSGKNRRSLLIVTTSNLAEDVARQLSHRNFEQFNLRGIAIMDRDMTGQEIGGIPVVANSENVKDYVLHEWVDEVFTCFTGLNDAQKKLVNQFIVMGVTVHEKLNFRAEEMKNKQFIEKVGNYTVLTTSINYATTFETVVKRLTDIIGGIIGCIFTLLLFPVMALIIRIKSPGPVIFSQKRVGKNGKVFKIYKFRTMYTDAEARKAELMKDNRVQDDMMFKLDFDPRIIGNKVLPDGSLHFGVGSKIRKLSLDEFPQFFNVLKGDMSLVGTRPPTLDEWEKYKLHHRARLAIKPGITGMWQVNGRSNITDFEKVVALDTTYIKNWSLSLDLKILIKTFAVVLKKEGSA